MSQTNVSCAPLNMPPLLFIRFQHPLTAAEPAADLSVLKVSELRGMCKSKGLSTSGNKEELIARLSQPAVSEASVTAAAVDAAASPLPADAAGCHTPLSPAYHLEPAKISGEGTSEPTLATLPLKQLSFVSFASRGACNSKFKEEVCLKQTSHVHL